MTYRIRKILSFSLVLCIVFSLVSVFATEIGKIKTVLNGQEVTTAYPPIYIEGSVFVPARQYANMLEYDVKWLEEEYAVEFFKMNSYVKLTLGSNKVHTSLGEYSMAKAPFILAGIIYAPLELINACFGFNASWNEGTRTITVNKNTNFLSREMVPNILERNVVIDTSVLNLIDNGDFEDGITGWYQRYNAVISEDIEVQHSGEASLRVQLNGGLASGAYNVDKILNENGKGTYIFEFWAKANKEQAVVVYAPNINSGKHYFSQSVLLTTEWQKYTVEKAVNWTGDIETAVFVIGMDNASKPALTFWLDDVTIIKK